MARPEVAPCGSQFVEVTPAVTGRLAKATELWHDRVADRSGLFAS